MGRVACSSSAPAAEVRGMSSRKTNRKPMNRQMPRIMNVIA
jgi:hypothetical protein